MIKPPSWSSREESLLLLNAYLDNELDAASVLDIEQLLATDAALGDEHERLRQLRSALANRHSAERASDKFKQRIAAIAEQSSAIVSPRRPPPARHYAPYQMAAAAALAALIAAAGTFAVLRPDPVSNEIASIIADHRRALLAATPYDVASSDRHTVKPWFDGKLALSPQVVDLSAEGFPLAGGRVEILDRKPVPVLVYQRRAHVISVVAIPRVGAAAETAAARSETRDGYAVIRWHRRDFEYFAVSDIPESELAAFVAAWRGAALRP